MKNEAEFKPTKIKNCLIYFHLINTLKEYIMDDPNGLQYTNAYMAQEYRNEASGLKYKLQEMEEENKKLKEKINRLEKLVDSLTK